MTAEGHLTFSVACIVFAKKAGLTTALAQGEWWQIVPAALLTSLLPDIDHPSSLLGRRIKIISLPIAKIFGHRGFTHSFLAVVLCVIALNITLPQTAVIPTDILHAMIIGYLSHLLADALTPAGVPFFWPYKKRFSIPLLRPQKQNHIERFFCLTLVMCALYWPNT